MFTTSPPGKRFIMAWEGVQLEPYKCPAGYWTVGVGHLICDGEDFSAGITIDEAMSLFSEDIKVYEDAVNRRVNVPMTQWEFDALTSWTFNLGEPRLIRSTMLKKLNNYSYVEAADEMLRWIYSGGVRSKGLMRRRCAERDMFLNGVYNGPDDRPVKGTMV